MADSVEDPEKFEAAGFERFGGAKDSFKISFGALIAEKHYPDGESDFRVDNVLHEELCGEIGDDEGIVQGVAEKGSDPFEGVEKAEEVRIRVAAANFFFGNARAMASGEFGDDCGTNAAFEMEMQFGFRSRKKVFRKRAVWHTSELSEEAEAGRRFSRR